MSTTGAGPAVPGEDARRRLAAIGIDLYRLRSAAVVDAPRERVRSVGSPDAPIDLWLLIEEPASGAAARLPEDIARALRMAGIRCGIATAIDRIAPGSAHGLVAFGATSARRANALPAVHGEIGMALLVACEPAGLAADAESRRALWSELKRFVRAVAGRGGNAAQTNRVG